MFLLFSSAAPLETIGLFGFAWTSLGPRHVHWIAPMIFSSLIAIANVSLQTLYSPKRKYSRLLFALQYAIYMATIDYMIASYGPYSASATGGNALARDFLAGVAAMYATPRKPILTFTHPHLLISSLPFFPFYSILQPRHISPSRMGLHAPRLPRVHRHDTHLHLLLQRPRDTSTVQVCADARER